MTEGWQSHGGAGGITAEYDDLESLAGVYAQAAAALGDAALEVGLIGASGSLSASAVLSPGSYGDVMLLIGELEVGRSGLASSGVELAALSVLLRTAVTTYRAADEALAALTTGLEDGADFVLGATLPLLAVPAALGVLSVEAAGALPGLLDDAFHGRASLSDFRERVLSNTSHDATDFVLDHPGLVQNLIGGAPGLETGLGLWAPLPMRPMLPFSGVPRNYHEALQGLAGFFRDGEPLLGAGGLPRAGDATAPHSVGDLLDGVDRRQDRQNGAVSGEIGIQTLVGLDGITRYVVQLPGTESWALTPGPTARDLGTNLHTMAGGATVYLRGVEQAMAQAGIAPDAPVMLVGHSQGGMTAAALAADPSFRSGYHHLNVVTAGAPIARFDIPPSVQVLALENHHDLVPNLDGLGNPDRPNMTTMTFDASKGSVGANHDLGLTYAVAAGTLPTDDASYAAWLDTVKGFFDPASTSITQTYQITRKAGP